MKVLEWQEAETLLKEIASNGPHMDNLKSTGSDPQDRIAYLRAAAVRELIDEAINSFVANKDAILEGRLAKSLLENSHYRNQIADIGAKCKQKVYKEKNKLQLEASGYSMITGLMDLFGEMIHELLRKGDEAALNMRNRGLYYLMPEEFREKLQPADPYRSMLVLVDFVSGMTDRYILDTYQRLTGSSVSLGRMN